METTPAEVRCGQCRAEAAFWLYAPDERRWRPRCERHAVREHPSIELKAWIESGYARPVERGRPRGPPPPPDYERAAAFRARIDDLMA